MANVTKAFVGDATALIDPYVEVSFFGQIVSSQFSAYYKTNTLKGIVNQKWKRPVIITYPQWVLF